jgi:hypothetical protein
MRRDILVEIDIIRNGRFYFYNRRINGTADIFGQRVTVDRAEEIYQTNAGEASQYATGPAGDFDPDGRDWSWTVRLTGEAVPS